MEILRNLPQIWFMYTGTRVYIYKNIVSKEAHELPILRASVLENSLMYKM